MKDWVPVVDDCECKRARVIYVSSPFIVTV